MQHFYFVFTKQVISHWCVSFVVVFLSLFRTALILPPFNANKLALDFIAVLTVQEKIGSLALSNLYPIWNNTQITVKIAANADATTML